MEKTVRHEARYRVAPAELPSLLDIKVPAGANIDVSHVSANGREYSIPDDSALVIAVAWETGLGEEALCTPGYIRRSGRCC